MAAQTQTRTAAPETAHLDCIHCGLCLSACPTYLQLGMEADSPRGRIYLIQAMKEGHVSAASLNFQQHMLLCLECRACETACPSGVRFSSMMDEARIEMRSRRQLSIFGRLAHWIVYRKVFPSRKIMHLGFRALRLYQRSGLQRLVRASGILRLLPSRDRAHGGVVARDSAIAKTRAAGSALSRIPQKGAAVQRLHYA